MANGFTIAAVATGSLPSMGRGMSRYRICGRPIPSIYRKRHEKFLCLKMRFDRGDPDVVARVLAKALPLPVKVNAEKQVEKGQKCLFAVVGGEGLL